MKITFDIDEVTVTFYGWVQPTVEEMRGCLAYVRKHAPADDVKNLVGVTVNQCTGYGGDDFVNVNYTVRKNLGVIHTENFVRYMEDIGNGI